MEYLKGFDNDANEKDVEIEPKSFFFIESQKRFLDKEFYLDLFTAKDRPYLPVPSNLIGRDVISCTLSFSEYDNIQPLGNVFHVSKKEHDEYELCRGESDMFVYGALFLQKESGQWNMMLFKISDDATVPPYTAGYKFPISEGAIANYSGDTMGTNAGIFFLNYALLVDPFGDKIPYHNGLFKAGDLDRAVAGLISNKEATRADYNKYMANGYWLADGAICAPGWSEKSMTIDPAILKRKKELLEQYKDVTDPLALVKIEKELVEMDKKYMEGDISEVFYKAGGEAKFSDQRKKLFITFGVFVAFDQSEGKYKFVEESLSDGWSAKNMAIGINDLRKGTYGRGVETAKGGEQTKFIMRIFQDVRIDQDDCGTKEGIHILITENNKKYYTNRYLVDGTFLSADVIKNYIGKEVVIRSPLYCRAKPGFCFKCTDEIFKKLDARAIGLNALLITSAFTLASMKTMHVSSVKMHSVKDIHQFLR